MTGWEIPVEVPEGAELEISRSPHGGRVVTIIHPGPNPHIESYTFWDYPEIHPVVNMPIVVREKVHPLEPQRIIADQYPIGYWSPQQRLLFRLRLQWQSHTRRRTL